MSLSLQSVGDRYLILMQIINLPLSSGYIVDLLPLHVIKQVWMESWRFRCERIQRQTALVYLFRL